MPEHTYPLGAWSPEAFISSCWQQEPLLVRNAMLATSKIVTYRDLAAIACKADAEARLVFSDARQKNWHCEQGPFSQKRLRQLPGSNWTLLVQSVDQWLPGLAGLLDAFSFLPRWRLDDIMVSYATEGGGVGPHFDYYDVFLLQVSGSRHWKLGQRCDDKTALRDHPDMKLLKQFKSCAQYTVGVGDLLYIPAGMAHWGRALTDNCITVSIGFRAASQRELIQIALSKIAAGLPESLRYRDTIAAMDNDPYCINNHAINTVQLLWSSLLQKHNAESIKTALAQALGEYATETRFPERVVAERSISASKLKKRLAKNTTLNLVHHPASRFAWRAVTGKHAELYVDGETHVTSTGLAQMICHRSIKSSALRKEENRELVLTLLEQGSIGLLE